MHGFNGYMFDEMLNYGHARPPWMACIWLMQKLLTFEAIVEGQYYNYYM